MISTLMLPDAVIMIPRYVAFNNFGWIDTYMPFWAPAVLACYPFLIFQQIQFMRSIPNELDESAYMDGCNPFMVYVKILAPLMKPAMFSVVIFQTLWRWNDYFNNLIYISSVKITRCHWPLRCPLTARAPLLPGTRCWQCLLSP